MISITDAQLNAWLAGFILPLARILGLIMVAPGFGHNSVPARVKIGLGIFITLAISPTLSVMEPIALYSFQGLLTLAMQTMIGIAMGFIMQLVFAAVEMAGELIGLQMGIGFATLYDPNNSAGSGIVSQLLSWLALLAFFATNAHLALIATLTDSFQALPITPHLVPGMGMGMKTVANSASVIFQSGVQLALPIIAVLLLTNIVLAVLTRSAPQMNIFAIGFPVTLGIGLIMLDLALPYYAAQTGALFQNSLASIENFLQVLGTGQ
jgi:flagellar biosynthetic protein FliR